MTLKVVVVGQERENGLAIMLRNKADSGKVENGRDVWIGWPVVAKLDSSSNERLQLDDGGVGQVTNKGGGGVSEFR